VTTGVPTIVRGGRYKCYTSLSREVMAIVIEQMQMEEARRAGLGAAMPSVAPNAAPSIPLARPTPVSVLGTDLRVDISAVREIREVVADGVQGRRISWRVPGQSIST
jgi:hypothetical protein